MPPKGTTPALPCTQRELFSSRDRRPPCGNEHGLGTHLQRVRAPEKPPAGSCQPGRQASCAALRETPMTRGDRHTMCAPGDFQSATAWCTEGASEAALREQ